MIPKIIHQTWKTENIPEQFKKYVQSWKTMHPGWKYMFWSDADIDAFIQKHYPSLMSVFKALTFKIQQVDAFRVILMYHFGGVYADLDAECVKPFDDLAETFDCVLGCEPQEHARRLYKRKIVVSNAVMMSRPRHPFWNHVWKKIVMRSKFKSVLTSTGPGVLTDAIQSYDKPDRVILMREECFCPKVSKWLPNASRQHNLFSYAVHHWANTWVSQVSVKIRPQQ